ncbi:EpsG family protein [Novosphingobium sp. TH158]|uniref:EpsG family protein n=1 Tax=Novosphingobium sp. TH158 TaxID=2067455 RepID=UPI000C7C346B|nr:EpsG family protein [Novosphingobium sp. TH158]PLK27155.1 hypothetical protein C0V78_09855 [Novosphingobium sp. TH158]
MLIYWLLFAFPALMALAYPVHPQSAFADRRGQRAGFVAFVVAYALIGGLRHETGGDWDTYTLMHEEIALGSALDAMTTTDPLFGLLNWISAQLGMGLYLVNGVCCLLLGMGTVQVAARMREPWLGILFAVPYLLIVVGMGYVRQGAAIGMMLMALASLDNSRTLKTIALMAIGTLFHSSASLLFPMFGWALVRRNKLLAVASMVVGAALFAAFFLPQLDKLELGYLEQEYDSGGAATRILMSLLPSMLVLARWRHFGASARVRSVWIAIALANFAALGALAVSSSSTAVDRIALYFSVIQIAAFGEIRALAGVSDSMATGVRIALVGLAAMIQAVFLIFATHAYLWVPYQSVLELL